MGNKEVKNNASKVINCILTTFNAIKGIANLVKGTITFVAPLVAAINGLKAV